MTALAAGDAVRGSMLYHVTYACTDCHLAHPGPNPEFPGGATAADITAAIQAVGSMRARYLSTLAQNQTDLDDIAAYLASPDAASLPDLNQHGLTGSWFEQATDGQGIELEVFPNHVAPGTSLVQGAWFTFDIAPSGGADRQRWYTFAGNGVSGQGNVQVTIYQNVGGNFNAAPTTNAAPVGSGTLSFADCDHATFTYMLNDGRAGAIPMTRLLSNVTCTVGTAPPVSADFAFSGNWFNATTSGQGFVFEMNPVRSFFFLTWYTYSPAGAMAPGASGQRWFTGQTGYTPGSRTIDMTLYETTGGVFDLSPPKPANNPVGHATVTFTNCAAAQVQFNFTAGSSAGQSGTITLQRVGPVPAGCGP